MLKSCESLQVLCRRAIIRAVGSRKRLRRLPLPRNIINWLREYDEPAAFDPNCSSDEVIFSNNNETIIFTGHISLYTNQFVCLVCVLVSLGEGDTQMRRLLKRVFITNFEPYESMEPKADFCLSCLSRKWLQHNIDPHP